MRLLVLSTVVAVVLLSGVAPAQTAPDAEPVPLQEGTAVVQPDGTVTSGTEMGGDRPDPDQEVICRVIQESGSRLTRRRQRVCGTRTMWEQMEDQNARDLRELGQTPARRD